MRVDEERCNDCLCWVSRSRSALMLSCVIVFTWLLCANRHNPVSPLLHTCMGSEVIHKVRSAMFDIPLKCYTDSPRCVTLLHLLWYWTSDTFPIGMTSRCSSSSANKSAVITRNEWRRRRIKAFEGERQRHIENLHMQVTASSIRPSLQTWICEAICDISFISGSHRSRHFFR